MPKLKTKIVKRTHKTHTGTNGTRLDERAMLVSLSIGLWEGRKIDKDKTHQVLNKSKAESDAGKWSTQIVPKHATDAVFNSRMRARATHFNYTLPWQDQGIRVLPASMFLEYTQAMRAAEADYRKTVASFLKDYPGYMQDAAQRLGDLFKPHMFPSASELAGKFPWRLHFSPLPTAGDFRVDLGAETTEEIRKSIQEQTDAAMTDAMEDLWHRLHDSVSKIAERLNDPEGIFRDTLIENVAELCELLPKMNITGNSELEQLRQDVAKKLSKQEPEVLRKNKPVRADAAKAANDILKRMEAFMPKKGK